MSWYVSTNTHHALALFNIQLLAVLLLLIKTNKIEA